MTDWARYWRSTGGAPMEAMYAHFERHVYHRHSHETYSFGVTERGAQSFTCRGAARVSSTGMLMAFNPDDPHDGHATDELGFTYRIVHLGGELVAGVLADAAGRADGRAPLPLFADPVVTDPAAAAALATLHRALLGDAPGAIHAGTTPAGGPTGPAPSGATALRRAELVDSAVRLVVARGATRAARPAPAGTSADGRRTAELARRYLADAYLGDLDGDELGRAVGRSRFAVYRAFRAAYGMAPSDYQRQLRLREARRLLVAGRPPADVAAAAGFADQAHLTRWFRRYFGVTPATFALSTA